MGHLYVLMVALMFSFGGTMVKLIAPYFSSEYITFFRFLVGVIWLLLLALISRRRFGRPFVSALRQNWKWILIGAFAKWLAYFTENYALSRGLSYGNIITQPVQTVFLTATGAVLYHDAMNRRKGLLISLCVAGILLVSLNGRPLSAFMGKELVFTLLFVISGMCAGTHILMQRVLSSRMDILESNLSIFSVSAVIALVPVLPSAGTGFAVHPSLSCLLAIAFFGFITGIGFYLNAKAIPLIPFFMVPLLQNTMVLFAILWGILFFHEPFTPMAAFGTVLFLSGIIGLQLQTAHERQKGKES